MITLSNIHQFTDEEVFDYVTEQLLIQNKRSGTATKCYYRSSDGSKCAVGLLMDEYHTSFYYCEEAIDINGNIVWSSMPLVHILDRFYPNASPRYHLLTVLQVFHDYFDVNDWPLLVRPVQAALFEGKCTDQLSVYGFLIKAIKRYHESI